MLQVFNVTVIRKRGERVKTCIKHMEWRIMNDFLMDLQCLCWGANNNEYIPFPYPLSEADSHLHFDKVSFSVRDMGRSKDVDGLKLKLFSFFEQNGYKTQSDGFARGKTYKRYRHYSGDRDILILSDPETFLDHLYVTVHDPDFEFLKWMDSGFKSLRLKTILSQMEIAIDFLGRNMPLYTALVSFLYLRHSKGQCRLKGEDFKKTFYIGDTRKDSKAIRLYHKEIDGQKNLRLELVLNRRSIKRLGLELPLEGFDHAILSDFICFKKFNQTKFFNHLKWKSRNKIKRLEGKKTVRTLFSVLNDIAGSHATIPVVDAKTKLKKRNLQYHRFFEDMDEWNEAFRDLLSRMSLN